MSGNDEAMTDELFAALRAKAREAHQRSRQLSLAAEDAADEARATDEAVAALSQLREEQDSFNEAARRFLES